MQKWLPPAFSNRQYQMWLNFAMSWDDPGCDGDYMARTRAIVEAYGQDEYARLGRIKAQYGPSNLFRANYNIVPSGGSLTPG